jgi:hypothetical protein
MTRETTRTMLLSSAIFNWLVAAGLFFIPDTFLGLLSINPLPEQSVWVQLFAGLAFMFGVAYYWASRDFEANVSVVSLGAIGKATVVLVALLNVVKADISWQFMIPTSADLLFTIFFIITLKSAQTWPARAII